MAKLIKNGGTLIKKKTEKFHTLKEAKANFTYDSFVIFFCLFSRFESETNNMLMSRHQSNFHYQYWDIQ